MAEEALQKMALKLTAGMKKYLLLLLVMAVIGCSGFGVGIFWGNREAETKIINDILAEQVNSIGELASIEYHYTNMGKFENQLDFYGWAVPLTKKSFIISYDGQIKAGVDMTQMAADIKDNKIVMTLPMPRILSHEIDMESLKVFDESHNIFNPISITDYQQFSLDQQAAAEQKAIDDGLLEAAREKTEIVILQLLNYNDEYILTFNWH